MTPTAPRDGEPGTEDWLRWQAERSPQDGGSPAAAPEPDRRPEARGPWLRHELETDDQDPLPSGSDSSPWLDPQLSTQDPDPFEPTGHHTGVPPTLAERSQEGRPEPRHEPEVGSAPTGDDRRGTRSPEAGSGRAGSGRARSADADEPERTGGVKVLGAAVKEFAIVVGMALVLSFVVKTWLLQAFYIPSGSMEDTLQVNDRVIVSKLTPGPVDLRRGDIIVFGDPGDWLDPTVEQPRGKVATVVRDTLTFVGLLPDPAENHLIKRVIGLPGDRVVCCDKGGRLTVNGHPIKEPYLKPGVAPSDQDFDVTVPRGRVWVMGDNRSGSADSRAHDGPDNDGRTGSVDERLIVGRAVALVWPLDHLTWLSNPSSVFRGVPAAKAADVGDQGTSGDTGTDVPTDGAGG